MQDSDLRCWQSWVRGTFHHPGISAIVNSQGLLLEWQHQEFSLCGNITGSGIGLSVTPSALSYIWVVHNGSGNLGTSYSQLDTRGKIFTMTAISR